LRRLWRGFFQISIFLLICVGVIVAWSKLMRPTIFFGQVEIIQSGVNSPDAGLLTNLWVAPFQEVKAGDLVAEIVTTDPRTANNRLEVLRDRMRLTELEMAPTLRRESSAIGYAGLIFACDKLKADLATARVNLSQASNQFERVSKLFQSEPGKVVSDAVYEKAKADFEALGADVEEKNRIVIATQKTLERLAYMANEPAPGGNNDPLKQALLVEEEKIKIFEQKMKPLQLLAPIAGVVTVVHHQAGEQIPPGQPIVLITSKESGRIVGFLPPGFPITPRLGMKVEVRTRGPKRVTATAKVTGIGPHLESVTNSLVQPVLVRPSVVQPLGRPISISLPPELKLLPGAPVDLRLCPE
jgi:multidrug resistance efflux pump